MSAPRRSRRFVAAALVLCGAGLVTGSARTAHAGPFDLDDEDDKKDQKKDDPKDTRGEKTDKRQPVLGPAPMATIKAHQYTLAECLALTDRNHPLLWAARARLAGVHAQLEEAIYTP